MGIENHSIYIVNRNGTVSGPVIAGLEILYFSVRFAESTYDDQDVMTSGFGFDDAVFNETVTRFQPVGGGSQTQVELDFSTRVFEFQATRIPIPGKLFFLSFSLVFFGLAARAGLVVKVQPDNQHSKKRGPCRTPNLPYAVQG